MPRKNEFTTQIEIAIGKKVSDLRNINGWSRQELAKMIEVTHQQLQKYENGTNRITVSRLMLIAKAFNKNPATFLDGLDADLVQDNGKGQRSYLEVARNFKKIRKVQHQNAVKSLIKSFASIEA